MLSQGLKAIGFFKNREMVQAKQYTKRCIYFGIRSFPTANCVKAAVFFTSNFR